MHLVIMEYSVVSRTVRARRDSAPAAVAAAGCGGPFSPPVSVPSMNCRIVLCVLSDLAAAPSMDLGTKMRKLWPAWPFYWRS